jgi:iron-regulated transporter 1
MPVASTTPTSTPNGTSSSSHEHHDADTSTTLPLEQLKDASPILWKLYLSHTLSTWNARTFEFSAVIFLAATFPGTLFYASIYALFRSLAAFLLSSWIGQAVDNRERLWVVRQTILWQRSAVACSCLFLVTLLTMDPGKDKLKILGWFSTCVVLACIEKLAFVGNTVAVERDWAVVVADNLQVPREDLNSGMRRIDLFCKLVAPLCIALVDGYSTKVAIWVVFGQNAVSVVFVSKSG